MDRWIPYIDKTPNSMTSDELLLELRVQRFFKEQLVRMLNLAEFKHKEAYKNAKAGAEALPEDAPSTQKGGLATQVKSVEQWEAKCKYIEMYVNASKRYVEELETAMVQRKQFGKYKLSTINKEAIDNILHKERYVRMSRRNVQEVRRVFNKDAFMAVARDRGYILEEAVYDAVAKELFLPYRSAKSLVNSGKWTWAEVLYLGIMFEMTPREFSEVFMQGYFMEVSDGQFRAWGNKEDLLHKLPKLQRVFGHKPESIIEVDDDGRPLNNI